MMHYYVTDVNDLRHFFMQTTKGFLHKPTEESSSGSSPGSRPACILSIWHFVISLGWEIAHLWWCLFSDECWFIAHVKRPVIVTSPEHTCALIMLFSQRADTPHLSGGSWITLAKDEHSLTSTLTHLWAQHLYLNIYISVDCTCR